ncbi:hypothetical protein HNY73_016118 [Argiope bruennichi]|uniref:Gustatory receptor n=1 Tax=Argiope bruennichi TaxID=94029 RepID=A0A8T0ELQ2_ARGBR|nr:hypothetical protein HNY73_016118 [Argiope bruennichi]
MRNKASKEISRIKRRKLKCKYGLLSFILSIYGIGVQRKMPMVYRIFHLMFTLLVHVIPMYTISVWFSSYLKNELHLEHLLGSILADILPLVVHYSIKLKKQALKHILMQYSRVSVLDGKNCVSYRKKVNFILISIAVILVILTTICIISMHSYPEQKLYYTFYINFHNNIVGECIFIFTIHFIFAYEYVLPCVMGLMCGVLYYEFSEYLFRFRKRLEILSPPFDKKEVVSQLKMHSTLFEVLLDLQEALSFICFFFLCTQMTIMFCLLSVFVLTPTENIIEPMISELVLITALAPTSVIGVVLCASRIYVQCQKIQIAIHLLMDSFMRQTNLDNDIMFYVKLMNDKQFPIMTAGGIVDLTPKLMLGLFGSLFTYGLFTFHKL